MLIQGREFEILIPAEKIATAVQHIGDQLNKSLAGKNPLFVIVLNGAAVFGADLIRTFAGSCEVFYMRVKSYIGMRAGEHQIYEGFGNLVNGRHIVIVEDIVDSGNTLRIMLHDLAMHQPAGITTVAILQKKIHRPNDLHADIVGFEIPDVFVVGYGLDYNEEGRNLKDVWKLGE
jgi:hypoxanthine phosphoribosyltransferase